MTGSPRVDPAPLLGATAGRLADRFREVDYTPDGVAQAIGGVAGAALGRGWTPAAEAALAGDGSPLATLIRLWPLQRPVGAAELQRALGELVDPLRAAGVLVSGDGRARAAVDIRPYGDERHDHWVVCDLVHTLDGATTPVAPDHVPGVGGASTTLAQLTVREPVDRALDLGTGNGVQALHLLDHAGEVVATDISARALAMAQITLALSGRTERVALRRGNLLEPVAEDRFDLIVSNPPFVVTPAGAGPHRGADRFDYRDSGLPGDDLGRVLLAGLPARLAPGGTAQLLANWLHLRGRDWRLRVTDWLGPALTAGCDAWVVQREVADPAAYAETWLRDAALDGGPRGRALLADWLAAFARDRVEGVGFGWVVLRASGRSPGSGTLRVEDWPHPVAQPLGPTVTAWARATDLLQATDDAALLALSLRVADGVDEERYAAPGAEDPRAIVVRQHTGLLRAQALRTATAGLVGACDGTLTVAAITAALAQLLDVDEVALRTEMVGAIRTLLADGFLVSAS